jgi:ribosome maturation factor RimP
VQDCVQTSRALEAAFETAEPIAEEYTLEVSSPGVNRPLVRLKDFENSQGKIVRIESQEPIEGRKRFHGRLVGFAPDQVDLTVDGKVFHIPLTKIKKASLDFFASEGM